MTTETKQHALINIFWPKLFQYEAKASKRALCRETAHAESEEEALQTRNEKSVRFYFKIQAQQIFAWIFVTMKFQFNSQVFNSKVKVKLKFLFWKHRLVLIIQKLSASKVDGKAAGRVTEYANRPQLPRRRTLPISTCTRKS